LAFDPGNLDVARVVRLDNVHHAEYSFSRTETASYGSAIDILVCTPGRLVDHLDNTPGFQLQHLRFLVVDEADRLLSQSYQNWIDRVIEDASAGSVIAWRAMETSGSRAPQFTMSLDDTSYQIDPITWRHGGSVGDNSSFNTNLSHSNVAASVCRPVQLRKFLVSATLTKDPQKLATLKLVNPKHFDVHQLGAGEGKALNKFTMVEGLSEYSIECRAEQKPLVLLALLLELLQKQDKKWTAVVFTSSVDSTHRLARLLQLLWIKGQYGTSDAVAEFSSALSQTERAAMLSRCRDPNDNLSIMICSDGMSRGMDLENIHAVINYDVPSLAKTYIHRCGRTARAGRSGVAITILKGGQVVDFERMRNLIQSPESVQTWNVKKSLVEKAVPFYTECLRALRSLLEDEESDRIAPTHPLDASFFDEESGDDADDESY
jgi:ATP-dependent RNA helicase DDX51/DBP6